MAPILSAIVRLRNSSADHLPFNPPIEQLAPPARRRHRLLPLAVMVRCFLIQVLQGNVAIAALRQHTGIDFALSSYCQARARLPLTLLQNLLQWLAAQATPVRRVIGAASPRVLIVDGSSCSMSDTPELLEHFGRPVGQLPGVGYPTAKLMGLLDAATGLFVQLLVLPLFQHDMRSAIALHPMLQNGDILLGDRAFCSFAHVALLNAQGVFACFRLHQRRKSQGRRGSDRWDKPKEKPSWMSESQFASLPASVDVRLVSYTVACRGRRTVTITIATTLMDQGQWPDDRIRELYGMRWEIETCFDHLKTTMRVNVLRCKSVDGVMKELAMMLIAYNMIRLVMLQAAARQGVAVGRISFVDAMRHAAVRLMGLTGVATLIVNPQRPGRQQLRVIRRRLKEYHLLRRSRREEEAKWAGKQGEMS